MTATEIKHAIEHKLEQYAMTIDKVTKRSYTALSSHVSNMWARAGTKYLDNRQAT